MASRVVLFQDRSNKANALSHLAVLELADGLWEEAEQHFLEAETELHQALTVAPREVSLLNNFGVLKCTLQTFGQKLVAVPRLRAGIVALYKRSVGYWRRIVRIRSSFSTWDQHSTDEGRCSQDKSDARPPSGAIERLSASMIMP